MSKTQQLFEELRPLALKIARGFQRKLPSSVLIEDLKAAAMAGLWESVRKYPNGGDELEWYARARIRGSIIDELRAQDWLPRNARRFGLPTHVIRIPDLSKSAQESIQTTEETAADNILEQNRLKARLKMLVDSLPSRERFIAIELFYRDRQLKEIAANLGISEPRISQLKNRLLKRLKTAMEKSNGTGNT